MICISTKQLAKIIDAKLIGNENLTIENLSIDSRVLQLNSVFCAIKGENFDGHNFINQAIKNGAVAIISEQQILSSCPVLIVENTRLALAKLAAYLKNQLQPKTVAITGSSGKTSVKEMLSLVLQNYNSKDEVLFTQGNKNNDLGVPLTLINLQENHKFAVVELGTNQPGDIAYSAEIVKPDVAVITNIAAAHLEKLHSIEGIAKEKSEIFRFLNSKGIAIINFENYQLLKPYLANINQQIFTFGISNQANFYASNIKVTSNGVSFTIHSPKEKIAIDLNLLGQHHIYNALAVTACAFSLGIDLQTIKTGLEQAKPIKGRLNPIQITENLLLLDDAYNANVGSSIEAIKLLQQFSGIKILCMGDLAEMGAYADQAHKEISNHCCDLNLVLTYGKFSKIISKSNQHHFENHQQMADFLISYLEKNHQESSTVLVKGSRNQRMEKLIELIQNYYNFKE